MRTDTERSRRKIIQAAGALFAAGNVPVTMTAIAHAANVSTATAYRHFASVDDALAAFNHSVGRELLDFSLMQSVGGLPLLKAVSGKWVSPILQHGRGMPYSRSGEGYVARLRAGTFYLTVQADALRRPLAEACAELGAEVPAEDAIFCGTRSLTRGRSSTLSKRWG